MLRGESSPDAHILTPFPARDDNEAIDESNIVDSRTRHAKPASGYREPGDSEGIEEA